MVYSIIINYIYNIKGNKSNPKEVGNFLPQNLIL